MTRWLKLTVGLIAVAVLVGVATQQTAAEDTGADDGKAVFLAQKCNMCHSVPAAEITAKTTSEKMKGPDLPSASELDDAGMAQYLKKETELNGALHKKEFKGTDDELKALIPFVKKPA